MAGPVVSLLGTIPLKRCRHGVNRITSAGLAVAVVLSTGSASARAETVDHYGAMVDRRASFEECVACHDGTIAKDVAYCRENCSIRTPHPIMRRYPPPGREAAYRPVEFLREAGIELADGMVVCISCHNLGNPPPFHLAVDPATGSLCLSCHIQ